MTDKWDAPDPWPTDSPESPSTADAPSALPWLERWPLWMLGTAVASGLVGFVAVVLLLRLPNFPRCADLFLPTASVSLRLYCAQEAAQKKDLEGLERAISLVQDIPETDPQRDDINRFLESWALDLLTLADRSAQAGKLEEAMGIAQRIPPGSEAARLAQEQLRQWQADWAEVTRIYEEAEAALRQGNWREALAKASLLPTINNAYVDTERYQDLNRRILKTREEAAQFEQAERLAKQAQLQPLLQAIAQIRQIPADSVLYNQAQTRFQQWSRDVLEVVATNRLKARDLTGALDAAQQVPPEAKLQEEVKDFTLLAQAESLTWNDTPAGRQQAITQAQTLTPDRPLYALAQTKIDLWQQEIVALRFLEEARRYASANTITGWRQAVQVVNQIPTTNPLWERASAVAENWINQIQTTEDSPILQRAEAIATAGTAPALSAAIAEAQRIVPGRALHPQARQRIRQWQERIEVIQDQPYLDAAVALANRGDVGGAISEAQRISAGRALYTRAQTQIRQWQGQQNLQEAAQLAEATTPEALSRGMQLALRVRENSDLRPAADQVIVRLSQQVLDQARQREASAPNEALALARLIPQS
ncbi:MAG: chromosome segregation ATPase, partial [Gloeomargaritaceae cyanobacterium C42_A2020_066]|nr:chromosome segregation ATPase [Gloeomargaritaceae cyanobacterium C42_A2020_066]